MSDKTTSPVSGRIADPITGPLNEATIEAVFGDGDPRDIVSRPESLKAQWADFFSFVRRPTLPDEQIIELSLGVRATLRILALDLLAMSVLLLIAGAVVASGIAIPETALAGMEITAGIAFAVIVVAPVSEELLFRSWLSGRPRYLVAIPIILITYLVAAMMGVLHTGDDAMSTVSLTVIVGILLALLVAVGSWKRPPMRWFRAVFPLMFWLSTIAFACIHLANFSEGNWMTLLPLVLPQFILGALLGYLRVNYGLWTAIALHMIHNGLIIALVLGATAASGA